MGSSFSPGESHSKIYRYFLASRFLFIFAMMMVSTAVAWHIYKVTGNKLSLGLLGLSEVIPAIALALPAGHVVDKSNKSRLLLQTMFMFFLASAGLWAVSSQRALQVLGVSGLEWATYILIFFTGIFRAYTGPSMSSIIAQLVKKDDLVKAVTYSSTAWQTAAVAGPVLGGFLIAWVGVSNTLLVALGILLLAMWAVSRLPALPPANANTEKRTWESVQEGIRYVLKTKALLGAMSLDMFAVFFGGAVAMLPVYAIDILHINAGAMGWLKAAQGLGTVLIHFIVHKRPLEKNQGQTMLLSVALFGVCIIVFGISTHFWLSFAALFFSGIFDGISVIVRSTIVQLYVPDEMRGRVSSVNSIFVSSSNEMGQFESGTAARLMGTVPSVVFGGCMTMLVVAIAWVKAPSLRKLQY